MRYSEFKREVEKLGCEVYDRVYDLSVEKKANIILTVSKNREFEFDNDWNKWSAAGEIKSPLFDLAYQLAKTPLAEREEEKRYWLQKIPVPLLDKEGEKKWLWKYTRTAPSNMFGVDTTKIDSELYKTIFTESEIAEMDITGFKKEPVE